MSEISEWGKWYEKAIPNAPKLLIAKAEKTFFKNRFYVRVPIKGSKGMVYFGKSQSLEAVFIRINPDNGIVSYPFTGNYEFIDLNKFTYKQITFNNGKIGQVFQNLMIDKGSISGAQTVKTNSWFSQLLHCIGQYILAVPAKINGEWSGCWVLRGKIKNLKLWAKVLVVIHCQLIGLHF
ncbi:MAG: hypothetical protein Q8L07_01370 [Sediminibacterium sp.]|nr:hypothetical protein [Sediminibacterium sp.]MDP3666655.1 hypothetical protein [Sediminibacterium sp.]